MNSTSSGGAFFLSKGSADQLAACIGRSRPGWTVRHDAEGWHAVHVDGTTLNAPTAGELNKQLAEREADDPE